jgi:hypothetical protein
MTGLTVVCSLSLYYPLPPSIINDTLGSVSLPTAPVLDCLTAANGFARANRACHLWIHVSNNFKHSPKDVYKIRSLTGGRTKLPVLSQLLTAVALPI